MTYRLGIDLGTTFSAAATWRDGSATIVELGKNKASIPSVVYFDEHGGTIVGESADHLAATNPARAARHFKRNFGSGTPQYIGTEALQADKATSLLLTNIIDTVVQREGSRPDHIVLTHPADWPQHKLDDLHQAAQLSGLESADYSLLPEPVAAAVHYASQQRVDVGDKVAVYDLGGGTFDAAVVQQTHTGFALLGEADGLERRGGVDFDDVVLQLVLHHLGTSMEALDTSDPAVLAGIHRLRADCTKAKEILSDAITVPIPVTIPGLEPQIEVTRSEFEQAIASYVSDTFNTFSAVISKAGTTADELRCILLVGGSSRIPSVNELLVQEYACPIALDTHPKHAVALGAATPLETEDLKVEPIPDNEQSGQRTPFRSRIPAIASWGLAAVIGVVVVFVAISAFGGGDDDEAASTTTSPVIATSPPTAPPETVSTVVLTVPQIGAIQKYANELRDALEGPGHRASDVLIDTTPAFMAANIASTIDRLPTRTDCTTFQSNLSSSYITTPGLKLAVALDELPSAPEPGIDFKALVVDYWEEVNQWYLACSEGQNVVWEPTHVAFISWCGAIGLLRDLEVTDPTSVPSECDVSLGLDSEG